MVGNQNKLYILGGINLKAYCDTSLFEITFDKQHIAMYYEEH